MQAVWRSGEVWGGINGGAIEICLTVESCVCLSRMPCVCRVCGTCVVCVSLRYVIRSRLGGNGDALVVSGSEDSQVLPKP